MTMGPGLRQLVDAAVARPAPPQPTPWPRPGESHEEWAAGVAAVREEHERLLAELIAAAKPTAAPPVVASIADVAAGDGADAVAARVYTPEGDGPFPAVVAFHGGGFWFGGGKAGMDAADIPCRTLCSRLGSVVVNVDYRQAPEHRFPVPLEDCYTATRWVAEHCGELGVDPGWISISGGSAGGNLAVGVALAARDRGGPALRFQLLMAPAIDPTMSYPSMTEHADDTEMTAATVALAWDCYFGPDADRSHPLAAALNADLTGLPPAHVVVGEFDPLRDEGIALADRLREAGVDVTVGRHHMSHSLAEPEVAAASLAESIAAMERANRR